MEVFEFHGLRGIEHPTYITSAPARLVQESSGIVEGPASTEEPGSSYLWVGSLHLLDQEDVYKLVVAASHWLLTGHLPGQLDSVVLPGCVMEQMKKRVEEVPNNDEH